MNKQKTNKGFTIIEVVLVLAIAGLIFLMVFIALPTLQKSQRDTQRKDDISRIQTQITAYSNNNRGVIPTSGTTGTISTFVKNYLGGAGSVAGSEFQDPATGTGYTLKGSGSGAAAAPSLAQGEFYYEQGALCGTDGAFVSGTARQYAIDVYLEGQAVPYCVDSNR